MTDHPVRSLRLVEHSCTSLPWRFVAGTLAITIGVSGCAERKRPTLPWTTASIVHPRLPATPRSGAEMASEDVPELQILIPLALATFPPGGSARPARPRVATPAPAAAGPSKPQAPFVAPQLSAEESSTAQQETMASLADAEKGLAATQGRSLNAAQSDKVSKITGFISDARAAGASGDWTSAATLARKAQLLAEELEQSLE